MASGNKVHASDGDAVVCSAALARTSMVLVRDDKTGPSMSDGIGIGMPSMLGT